MRDLLVFGVMFILIPLGVRNITAAFLLWSWTGLVALNTFVYGFMSSVPFVQVFAIITLGLLLRGKNVDVRKFNPDTTTILFLILAFHAVLCASFAYPGISTNWFVATTLLKTLLFCVLMPLILTTRLRIYALVVLIATAIGFYSSVEGLRFLNSGGSHHIQSIANLGDNNHTALAFVMALPLLWYLFQYSEKKIIKFGFASAFFLTCLAVIASNSRGGMLCMVAVAIWIVLKSRRKFIGAVLVIASGVAVVQLAPESWFTRMDTISTAAETDGSFQGRLNAWKRSSAIALENPIFGGGFRAVQTPSIFEIYKGKDGLLGFVDTPPATYAAAAHSIYFESMGDMGFIGFFIFMGCLLNAFLIRMRLKNLIKDNPKGLGWASDLSDSIAGSLVAYMVGGAAVSMAYFELAYVLMMLMAVLEMYVRRNLPGKARKLV